MLYLIVRGSAFTLMRVQLLRLLLKQVRFRFQTGTTDLGIKGHLVAAAQRGYESEDPDQRS